jgi:ketosteroid isomerase-like protein
VAWNAHDLDELLGHFSDDVVFTSPVAAELIQGSGGVIRGKDALRDYWALGLKLIPDLRFTVEGVWALPIPGTTERRCVSGGAHTAT